MTAFKDSIPEFMRRPRERAPVKLEIKYRDRSQAAPLPPRPQKVIHGGLPPVQPEFLCFDEAKTPEPPHTPGTAVDDATHAVPAVSAKPEPSPWQARREVPGEDERLQFPSSSDPAPKLPAAGVGVVDLTARRSAELQAEAAPREMNHALQAAFGVEPGDFGENDDVAFQVTLPRSVIRQIRVFAAEQGTTHRAVVLRALRASGLNIPEGADVDRRAVAAKRRHLG